MFPVEIRAWWKARPMVLKRKDFEICLAKTRDKEWEMKPFSLRQLGKPAVWQCQDWFGGGGEKNLLHMC